MLAGLVFRLTSPSEGSNPASAPLVGLREALAPFIIELLGTFLLCFTVATAASPAAEPALAPIAIGAMLMGQI